MKVIKIHSTFVLRRLISTTFQNGSNTGRMEVTSPQKCGEI